MKKFHFWKSVFWDWILSYLILAAIMLLFGGALFGLSINTVRQNTEFIQDQSVEQLTVSIETMLDELYKVSYTLSTSAYETGIYLERGSENDHYSPFSVAQIQKTMVSYGLANTRISKIYLFFPDNGYLISQGILYPCKALGSQTEKFTGFSMDTIDSFTEGSSQGKLFLVKNQNDTSSIFYAYANRMYHDKILVFMELDSDALQEMTNIENTDVCLLIDDEEIWFSEKRTPVPSEIKSALDKQKHIFLQQPPMIWTGINIKGHASLVTAIENSAFYAQVIRMRNLLIGYVIFAIILSGLVSYFFTRHQYKPLKDMISSLGKNHSDQISSKTEYEIISDYYAMLRKEYSRSNQELRDSWEVIQNGRLSEILHSNEDTFPEKTLLRLPEGELFLDSSSYLIGLLINEEHRDPENETSPSALRFMVQNIVKELLQNAFPTIISGEADGFILFWVRQSKGDHSNNSVNYAYLQQHLNQAVYNVERICEISITVNVSCLIPTVKSVGKAFDEIKEIQEYRDWDDHDDLKIRYMGLLEGARKEINSSYGVNSERFLLHKQMQEYLSANKYTELYAALKKYIGDDDTVDKKVCKPRNVIRKSELVNEIREYIDNNYNDWQLSGSMFADKYDVSLSYLSQIFKKETGVGLLDYINRTRYLKAKDMIDSGMTIHEAAEKAGYSSPQPLRRLFRQFEGMTPSQSRKLNEKM